MPRARESDPLADPVRVAALRGTGLIGTKQSQAFERIARLAATFVKAPMAMVALLDGTHLHALSRIGPPDLAKAQRTPVKDAFCRHVVASGEPLIVEDAREHEQTAGLASVKSGKVLAYAGIPLRPESGHVLGTLCVADAKPRAWKTSEIAVLEDLAHSAVTEIEVRADVAARRELQRANLRLRSVLENCPVPIFAKDLEGNALFANAAAAGAADAEAITFPLLDEAGEPYGTCGIVGARGDTAAAMGFEHAPASDTVDSVPETGELGSAKALLRRLETAVDAAQSALSSALPEDDESK